MMKKWKKTSTNTLNEEAESAAYKRSGNRTIEPNIGGDWRICRKEFPITQQQGQQEKSSGFRYSFNVLYAYLSSDLQMTFFHGPQENKEKLSYGHMVSGIKSTKMKRRYAEDRITKLKYQKW